MASRQVGPIGLMMIMGLGVRRLSPQARDAALDELVHRLTTVNAVQNLLVAPSRIRIAS
jgi:hypothetical protein